MPRSRRAPWSLIAAALAVSAALAGGVTAAYASTAAPTPTPSPGEATIVYSVTKTVVTTDSDGVEHPSEPETAPVTLACTATSCRFLPDATTFYLSQLTWAPGTAPAPMHIDGNTSSCSSDKGPDGDVTLTIDAAALTGSFIAPSPGWQNCDGTDTYRWAMVISYSGTYVSGDTCILDVGGCPSPTPTPTATLDVAAPADGEPAALSSSELSTGDAAAPSVLSTLPTPAEAGTAPSQLLLATALAVVLVLLVAFPTALLNSAVESGSDRLSEWWRGRRTTPPADAVVEGRAGGVGAEEADTETAVAEAPAGEAAAPRTSWSRTWWWAAAGVAAASVLSAFVDPGFGFNAGSVRVVLSILVSFVIDVVLGWAVVVWLIRRLAPGATHSYVFQPLTLLVVIAAVLFTRITGFEPGIVFGLVAGVAFGALAGRAHEARAALTTLGYAFGIALIAWVAYGLLGGGAAAGGSFWATFAVETLSSIAIGGMAALPIALFPVRGLAGYPIWAWNRWVWGACYAVGLFAFFVVLMPMPFSWDEVSLNLATWIGVYLAYAVVAVVAWLVIAKPWVKDGPDDAATSGAETEEEAEPVGRLEG